MSTPAQIEPAGQVPVFTLTDRLRKAREVTGLSQANFARDIDVSPRTVNSYENGSVEPRRIVLKAWAMRSGVPLKWIETGAVNEESPSPDGDGLSAECTPRDLNPEPTDIRSLFARRSARQLQATGEQDVA